MNGLTERSSGDGVDISSLLGIEDDILVFGDFS